MLLFTNTDFCFRPAGIYGAMLPYYFFLQAARETRIYIVLMVFVLIRHALRIQNVCMFAHDVLGPEFRNKFTLSYFRPAWIGRLNLRVKRLLFSNVIKQAGS